MEAAKYAECRKSHLRFWGQADGCQEYKECTASPLTCEICGCHRSFHRKVEVAAPETQVRYEKAEVVCTKCHKNLGFQRFSRTVQNKSPVAHEEPNPNDQIKRKTISFLEEFFRDKVLEETLQRVVELKSPNYHPEFVREAISLAFKKGPPCDEQVSLLIEHLFQRNVLNAKDIGTGCRLYATSLRNLAIDIPNAPDMFGKILGNFVAMAGALEIKAVNEIVAEVDDIYYEKVVFGAAMEVVESMGVCSDICQSFLRALS